MVQDIEKGSLRQLPVTLPLARVNGRMHLAPLVQLKENLWIVTEVGPWSSDSHPTTAIQRSVYTVKAIRVVGRQSPVEPN